MAKSLVEYETLDSDQIDDIMAGAEPRAPGSKENKTENKEKNDPSVGDAAEQSWKVFIKITLNQCLQKKYLITSLWTGVLVLTA